MFHIGKVLKIFGSDEKTAIGHDKSVQILLEMWDENLLIVGCEDGLGEKVKETDVVLVDYTPLNVNTPVPRQVIIKILRGELGKKTWDRFANYNQKRKNDSGETEPAAGGLHVR